MARPEAGGGGRESNPPMLRRGATPFGISKSIQDNPYSPPHHQLLHLSLPTTYPSNKPPVKGKFGVVIHCVCMREKHPDPNRLLLINQVTFCPLGVKRSPSEMAEGDVDVASTYGPYNINNLSYSEEDFDKLVNLCYYNVQNNKDLILQALRTAVERKKQQKKAQPLQKPPSGDGMCVSDREGTQHLANCPAPGNTK